MNGVAVFKDDVAVTKAAPFLDGDSHR